MIIYQKTILRQALKDLDTLSKYISEIYIAPSTAKSYTEGILNELRSLSNHAESIPISTSKSVLNY